MVEILAILYTYKEVSFSQLKSYLKGISSKTLSEKLKMLGRYVLNSRPVKVKYSLTDDGLVIARLGEPIFLYLRLREGLFSR